MAGSCLRLPTTAAAAAAAAPIPASSSSSSQLVATIPSRCSSQRKALAFGIECRSPFLGTQPRGLYRSRSVEIGHAEMKKKQPLRRAVSADLQSFDQEKEEFVKKLHELVLGRNPGYMDRRNFSGDLVLDYQDSVPSTSSYWQPSGYGPSDWPGGQAITIPPSLKTISDMGNLPVSLRIIKQKKQQLQLANWDESLWELRESTRDSVSKAFLSMVFMIGELQSYTIDMRQTLLYKDVKGVLSQVQQEMLGSFVWLFQQVFSCTPTLMVLVMLLLADFTVFSMSNPVATAVALPPLPEVKMVLVIEHNYDQKPKQSRSNQAVSVGGSTGGGDEKVGPITGSTGDGRSEGSSPSQAITHADVEVVREEDDETVAAWNRVVAEAREMQASLRCESLMDPSILKRLVAPVTVEVEQDAYFDYLETELKYQLALQQDPDNSLLLCNFAQFNQFVLHDNERAEYYYKKSVEVEPADGQALSKYATFLWLVKNDIAGAEVRYQEAIHADPDNSFHHAAYAHFLWNTGGDDTCYYPDAEC